MDDSETSRILHGRRRTGSLPIHICSRIRKGAVANTEKVLATAPSLFIGAKKAQKNKSDRKTLKKYNRAQGEESSDIIQRKKVVQNTMVFHAIAEFMNIKGKGKKEKLHFDVLLTAEKESSEGKILF